MGSNIPFNEQRMLVIVRLGMSRNINRNES